jgi:hypothetical protein
MRTKKRLDLKIRLQAHRKLQQIKSLLTEAQQKELEMIRSMSYEEVNKWAKQFSNYEGKSIPDNAQYFDMTIEEFIKTYDLIDITDRIMRYARPDNK